MKKVNLTQHEMENIFLVVVGGIVVSAAGLVVYWINHLLNLLQ